MIRPGLFIAYGEHGRGVFTGFPIPAGTVVEVSPVIDVVVTGLEDYVYKTNVETVSRLAFGYGSLYAHSKEPNLALDHGATCIVFTASRDIASGEELVHDYGEEWWTSRGMEPR